jgi:hypothetical protein
LSATRCYQRVESEVRGSGRSVHDPIDPVGRLLCNLLAMVAEFESD